MDLGKKLRETLAKLTNKPYVDEDAVKSLIKDLQRVLISSDVNVKLVFKLSKKIEDRALKSEKLEALSLREHVMKVVYEELVELMGTSYSPRLDKHRILVCGLFGSGKCIHKDSIIPLADGRIKTIKEIYDEYATSGEDVLDDGYKIDCLKNGPDVYSFNKSTLKIEKRQATTLWKLRKKSKLLKISLDNGNNHSIIVTPEHPFFILNNGEVMQVRADSLKENLCVATSSFIGFEGTLQTIDKEILNKFEDFKVSSSEISALVKTELKQRFGTLDNAFKTLEVKEAYCTFTANLKQGRIPVSIINKLRKLGMQVNFQDHVAVVGSRKGAGGLVASPIHLPTTINEELAEFLGYIFGDGYVYKYYVEITNNDEEILSRVNELSKNLFKLEGKVEVDKRNGVKRIRLASKLLVLFLNKIFGLSEGKKSHKMILPDTILKSPKNVLKFFIRAYFDTDGYVEKNRRHLEFASASKFFIEQLRMVLQRYNIFSNISKKTIKGKDYHRLFLKSDDVNKFHSEFSSILPRKRERFERLSKITGQTPGIHQLIQGGSFLKYVREIHGLSIGEIQERVSSYGVYETEGIISRNSLIKFLSVLETSHKRSWLSLLGKIKTGTNYSEIIAHNKSWATASLYRLEQQNYISKSDGRYDLTPQGEEILFESQHPDPKYLNKLKHLAYSDVCWLKVNAIEEVDEEEYVYDLTVDDLHTFVANGIVVHNTTSTGKIANYYKSKGLSVGVVAADVDRPAAQEQLEQISKQVHCNFYTIKGEKNAAKIVEDALKKSKDDVLIVDSAGRSAFDDQMTEELKSIASALNQDETYLVVSADIGQIAGKQSEQFNSAVPLSGVLVTKMEGSGKGGGALSAVSATGAKIAFIGLGEKMDDLEVYDSERFVGRLLGVPDLKGLMEKVEKISKETDIEKIATEELTIESFYEQLKAAKKMGPLGNVFSMLGAADLPKEFVQQSEDKLKKFENMINSMAAAEKKDAKLIRRQPTRITRIANGSGCTEQEVREFLSQFEKMEKMMGQFKKNRGFRKKVEQMLQGGGMKNINPGGGLL
jgi:signal recognition particle subunit SRP54